MRIGKGKVISETRQVSKVFYSTPTQKNVDRQMTQSGFIMGFLPPRISHGKGHPISHFSLIALLNSSHQVMAIFSFLIEGYPSGNHIL